VTLHPFSDTTFRESHLVRHPRFTLLFDLVVASTGTKFAVK
jgi:hypothetical protein